MSFLQRSLRITALVMAVVMIIVSFHVNAARAGLVKTEDVIEQSSAKAQRDRVIEFLRREDVRQQITDLGIRPEEAAKRVEALSNAEVAQIAGYLDTEPAGQSAIAAVFLTILVILLVLILTDLLGLTDIFPFIKSQRR
jgi:hypothetical protein